MLHQREAKRDAEETSTLTVPVQQFGIFPLNGCTEEQFFVERQRALDCMTTSGVWKGRNTTCKGQCKSIERKKFPAGSVPEGCDAASLVGILRFKHGCAGTGRGIWFTKPGTCYGECFWDADNCAEKLAIVDDYFHEAHVRGIQASKVILVDPVTCDVQFESLDD